MRGESEGEKTGSGHHACAERSRLRDDDRVWPNSAFSSEWKWAKLKRVRVTIHRVSFWFTALALFWAAAAGAATIVPTNSVWKYFKGQSEPLQSSIPWTFHLMRTTSAARDHKKD
jgi:hypothetical protein